MPARRRYGVVHGRAKACCRSQGRRLGAIKSNKTEPGSTLSDAFGRRQSAAGYVGEALRSDEIANHGGAGRYAILADRSAGGDAGVFALPYFTHDNHR